MDCTHREPGGRRGGGSGGRKWRASSLSSDGGRVAPPAFLSWSHEASQTMFDIRLCSSLHLGATGGWQLTQGRGSLSRLG